MLTFSNINKVVTDQLSAQPYPKTYLATTFCKRNPNHYMFKQPNTDLRRTKTSHAVLLHIETTITHFN